MGPSNLFLISPRPPPRSDASELGPAQARGTETQMLVPQTCGRQPTPRKTREGLLEGAPAPTGKGLSAAGASTRVLVGRRGKGPPVAWGQPTAPRQSRAPTAEPAGPGRSCGEHPPTPAALPAPPGGQRAEPRPGGPLSRRGYRLSSGGGVSPGCWQGKAAAGRSVAARCPGEEAPGEAAVLGGSAPGGMAAPDLDSRSEASPQERERHVSSQLCHAK